MVGWRGGREHACTQIEIHTLKSPCLLPVHLRCTGCLAQEPHGSIAHRHQRGGTGGGGGYTGGESYINSAAGGGGSYYSGTNIIVSAGPIGSNGSITIRTNSIAANSGISTSSIIAKIDPSGLMI